MKGETKMEYTKFNKCEVFKEKIAPLIDKIDELCGTHQIPFYFTAAVANNEAGTAYECRARTAAPMGISLMNDLMVNHVKVAAGFDVVFPDTIPDIEL